MASIKKRPNGKWRARYRDAAGHEHARHFPRKVDAQQWLDTVTADLLTGRYVDPRAGRTTFEAFATKWLAAQTTDVSTREATASRVRVHLMPTFGRMELRAIRPSTVQQWLRGRTDQCAPSFVRVLLANLSAILGAAVEDGLIATNPCASPSVRAPAQDQRRVVPWTREWVGAVTEAHPARYQAVPFATAGLGIRQGEVFGLPVEDVDFLRRKVLVRQQLKLVKGRPVFAPPKGGREREVPLPDVVAVALSEHLRQWAPVEVTLPWKDLDGADHTSTLVFTSRESKPINRNHYNPYVWKPALEVAKVEPTRANGMHALRHYYASVLLSGGVSIRALADYLGHADPGFTLRVYSHLMPDDEDRARSVADSALGPRADSVRTTGELQT